MSALRGICWALLACLCLPLNAMAQNAMAQSETTSLLPESLASAPEVPIASAIESTKKSNISWRSLAEFLVQAEAGKDIAWGVLLPKLQAEVTWLHLGERHSPDMGSLADMGLILGEMMGVIIEEHPAQAARFLPFIEAEGGDENAFDAFVPVQDSITGTFTLVVPVINAAAIPMLQGSYDRVDATVQTIGHGREQLLYGVAKAYYGLCTVQNMISVTTRSIEAANEHYRSAKVRANLQVATKLEVKRAELEVAKAEGQMVELLAGLAKGKASFRYLSGVTGEFRVLDPELLLPDADKPLAHWQELAKKQRKDLVAAKINVAIAKKSVKQVWMKYVPTLNLIGQLKLDNNQAQRFDDDPASWVVMATLSANIWDGGIREAELEIAESRFRQEEMKVEDLERQIDSMVASAYQSLIDARASRAVVERQLDVAKDTQALAQTSEKAGVATNLQVIDANTMVFASEAQFIGAKLGESIAILDLLGACGAPVPF